MTEFASPRTTLALVLLAFGQAACSPSSQEDSTATAAAIDACQLALLPQSGSTAIDRKIARLQMLAGRSDQQAAYLERLGWAYVAKARAGFDSGLLTLAEQTARCIDTTHPGSLDAALLRAHVLHQQHRFVEAEPIARRLVAERGRWFDHAVLGDVLLERGAIDAAAAEYQRMMDLRPGPEAYTRGAQLRWLTGDVDGASELMFRATRSAAPADPEAAAWAWTRLAQFEWQRGKPAGVSAAIGAALSLQPGYPPAQLLAGRLLLAENRFAEAVAALSEAAGANPMPEFQWALSEALHEAGQAAEAGRVTAALLAGGARNDPRTLALYLATTGSDTQRAVALASAELDARQDVMSLDAMAWATAAAGDPQLAAAYMERALAAGTRDARLCYHAAAIAHANNELTNTRQHLVCAAALAHMLLPSERRGLNRIVAELAGDRPVGGRPAAVASTRSNLND